MKKIIILICVICSLHSEAQISFNDTVNHITGTVYAGTLAGPKVSIKNANTQGLYSLRAGGTISWSPAKWCSIFGLGAGETNQTDTTTGFGLFGVNIHPNKIISVTIGKIPSPMTEMRPVPTTGAAQFEPWTKARIFGSAVGGKIQISATEKLSFVAGNFWRGTESSSEFGFRYGVTSFTGYYLNQTKTFGGALDVTFKSINTVIAFNQHQNVAMFNLVEIHHSSLFVYSDVGFNPDTWKMLRGEWGFLKTTHVRMTIMLLGFGYAQELQCVKGYIFIHL